MTAVHKRTKVAIAALALSASFGVAATPLTIDSISGSYLVWDNDVAGSPELQKHVGTSNYAAAQAALDDTHAGGNIELNKFGGALTPLATVTTLTGHANDKVVTLSSLQLSDWHGSALDDVLATNYIKGAAGSVGLTLDATQLTTAINNFFTVKWNGQELWRWVSDPNISYAEVNNHTLTIGLAGFKDISFILTALGIALTPDPQNPRAPQASEVVKVTFAGVTSYLYSFGPATDSGVYAPSGNGLIPNSFTADYAISAVPEPAVLALLGVGLLGVLLTRRRA
jgi:hypothetical protein